jgi:arylsulfate sulfotransferase
MKTKDSPLEPLAWRNALRLGTIMAIFVARCAHALTVLSGPSFSPAANAPLAGVLALTTDTDSQVSVSVSDGIGTWEQNFFDYGTNHCLTLLGFKADRTNEITVTVRDKYRNTYTFAEPVTFITSPLPEAMPTFTLLTNNPAEMEPGYTLFCVLNQTTSNAYVTIVDSSGEVVWYEEAAGLGELPGPLPTLTDVKQLTNGDLFFPELTGAGFGEVNMLGQTVRTWTAPEGYPVNNHEDLITDHGTILYLNYTTQFVSNFPSSATDPTAPKETADVTCGQVVEISYTNSALLNTWSLIDMLDPVRIDYLCFLIPSFGIDAEHANAIIEDTNDDSLIVSMRNQDAVIKFTRTGQLKWILGPTNNWGPEWQPYLLTPVGTPFAWNYAQHAPTLTPQGTLLLYDDGNDRAEPFDPPMPDQNNYSRAAEFSIDETNMQVSQVWQYTGTNDDTGANDDRLYTDALGNAPMLPQTGNVLVTFGLVSYENGAHPEPIATNATIVRIKEVTHQLNPSVVFDLELSDPSNNANTNSAGFYVYRSHRIPDLYSHLANPVANLTVQIQEAQAVLQFTADPALTYVVQSSDDLVNWDEIGVASPDDANGDFSFQDEDTDAFSVHFYRVLTQ